MKKRSSWTSVAQSEKVKVDERGQETSALDLGTDWSAHDLGGDLSSKPRRQLIEENQQANSTKPNK